MSDAPKLEYPSMKDPHDAIGLHGLKDVFGNPVTLEMVCEIRPKWAAFHIRRLEAENEMQSMQIINHEKHINFLLKRIAALEDLV